MTKRAINFVKRHKQGPFFLHLAHYAPHRPLSAPKQLVNQYLKKGFDEDTATVYAMIEIMDKGVGELIEALEVENIRNNTLVIFASDNGPDPLVGERFNHHLRGTKYTIYEGGIHVPLFFNWKGTLTPSENNVPVHFTDILPTLLEVCNLQMSENLKLDGSSISSLLKGNTLRGSLPKYRFWQWNRGVPFYSHNAAVRDGNWKLVRPYVTRNLPMGESDQKPMLYNTREDPGEKTNLAEKENERYNIMSVKLEQWCREVEWDRLSKR